MPATLDLPDGTTVNITPLKNEEAEDIYKRLQGQGVWVRRAITSQYGTAMSPNTTDYGIGIVVGWLEDNNGDHYVLVDLGPGGTCKHHVHQPVNSLPGQCPQVVVVGMLPTNLEVHLVSNQYLHEQAGGVSINKITKPCNGAAPVAIPTATPGSGSTPNRVTNTTCSVCPSKPAKEIPDWPHKCNLCGFPAVDLFNSTVCSNSRCTLGGK